MSIIKFCKNLKFESIEKSVARCHDHLKKLQSISTKVSKNRNEINSKYMNKLQVSKNINNTHQNSNGTFIWYRTYYRKTIKLKVNNEKYGHIESF